ncbi:MAG: PucR family transcriptional regulator ligand-binding domain-containing protein [Thermoanaerobacteraceae bacterium]|nr:PucR family transcriptional regulator ligand-binding domain-containing protein [Thermoanaerobacteraceae bacterium]
MLRERGITVKEALELDVFKSSRVVAGEKGLDRVITSVNVMEVPDIIDWVKPGEFLVTAFYSLRDNIQAQRELIPHLDDKGLAAIGIKPRRYLESIDAEMLAMADRLNFPIIEISYEVSFSDVIGSILSEIVNRQAMILEKQDVIHENLMQLVLNGGGLKDIVTRLYEMTGKPVLLRDMVYSRTFSAGLDEEELKLTAGYIKGLEENNIIDRGMRQYEYGTIKIGKREFKRLTVPVRAGDQFFGFLYVLEKDRGISPLDIRAAEISSTVAAFEFTRESAVSGVIKRYKNEFLDDLLSSDEVLRRMALERAESFGFDVNRVYRAYIVHLQETDAMNKTYNNYSYIQDIFGRIMAIISRELSVRKLSFFIGTRGGNVAVLMEERENPAETVDAVYRAVKAALPCVDLVITAGRVYSGINELWRSYMDATVVLSIARVFKDKKVIFYEDLGIYRLLASNDRDELNRFYNETIKPIKDYDSKHDTELIKTLQAFFEANGNLKKMSDILYTHYNTVLYRLQRIKEISGRDLEDPVDRMNMSIALKIMELLENDF